ncbi:hypothetical protein FH972_007373 [Carpinus fangiana]|uniref:FBD domain-containing protein n=1 Tax=Carpinus fangiana TaxID=176857 RepID=A0A5N6QW72_9ROSI|nr:hypothetical protein FH972_007373 [Carpinus fangiana]
MLCILKLPSAICLSSLKILRIQRVSFSNEYLTGKLFSGLPVLEEMKLENCSWGHLKSVSISAPKLLSIFEDDEQKRKFGNPDFCRVTIVGDRLKEFDYNGNLIDEYWLLKSSSLEKACIHSGCDGEIVLRMINLLKGLYNVEQLTLDSYVLWVLMDAYGHLHLMPMFNNLTDLILVGICIEFSALFKILHKSPCLNTLNFSEGINLTAMPGEENNDWKLDPVPPCFLSNLKQNEVHDFSALEDDLPAVEYLLNNAVVLDQLIITLPDAYKADFECTTEVCRLLLELSRASRNCRIILE